MKIELIPAPHEERYSGMVAKYLLEKSCECLCLEFPKDVERYVEEYSRGQRSYERLRRILLGGEIISPIFEKGYRPLLQVLPELSELVGGLRIHCYEDFDTFNDWVFKKDEFVLQIMGSDDCKGLEESHQELVEETKRRNGKIVDEIKEIAGESESKVYVVIGRLHAPLIRDELGKDYDLKETVLEDVCLTLLDESIILKARGEELGKLENYLKNHRRLAKEAGRAGKDVMELLRKEEIGEEHKLKKYSYF